VLARTGWSARFTYERALELLGADPLRTAAVEDSTNGIRSADAARIAVVAIPNREFPPEPAALALATRVLPKLDALTVETVRAALDR
jgi:beta-phosphoglucomutase-like phosphatase (HAD superfamily)